MPENSCWDELGSATARSRSRLLASSTSIDAGRFILLRGYDSLAGPSIGTGMAYPVYVHGEEEGHAMITIPRPDRSPRIEP